MKAARMLVYGDIERVVHPKDLHGAIAESLRASEWKTPGLERHALLVRAFIQLSELVQGLADAEFQERGADDLSEVQEAGAQLLLALARTVGQSWTDGFASDLISPLEWPALLERLDSGGAIRIRRAEGYAFYALYPEAYYEAARRSGLSPNTVVVGIRSIGTGLSAMVAAGLRARPAVTVRPVGHPFSRRVQISSTLADRILKSAEAEIAVVDEGPGLSGSSFGGVADWLEARGVARERLHFFPGHGGELGPRSAAHHRQRWAERPRHIFSSEDLVINAHDAAHRLETWLAELLGPLEAPLRCLSGGAWRTVRYDDELVWPPSDMQRERRKFLARADGTSWLVKFAGLGEEGECKLRKGRVLADSGYTPEIAGLCHGFLVERWVEGMPLNQARLHQGRLVERLGHYIGFRAGNLPASHMGASISQLFEMAAFNTAEALGQEASSRLKAFLGDPERFDGVTHAVDTDNRLHPWEWLMTRGGHLIKTDGLDHSAAHDLVGCQDVAWDVAGASVEFALSPEERAQLADVVSRTAGREVDGELIAVFVACYAAFQTGLWTHAAVRSADDEKPRNASVLRKYTRRLDTIVSAGAG